MNFDFDISIVSRFFRGVLAELRQKKLWPVAVVLLLACVAVPVLLSKSSSAPAPGPQAQLPTAPPSGGTAIPTLNVQSNPSQSRLPGKGRDPFAGSASSHVVSPSGSTLGSTAAPASVGLPVTGGVTGASAGAGASGSSTLPGVGSTSSGTPPASTVPSITQGAKPKPAPSGLTSTQAYDVSLAMTNSSGGIDTTDPLERLSPVPSEQEPLLVELGVEQGGNRVLFAVMPGTVPSGPGSCTPGPIDCEILSLAQDQTEQISSQTGSLGSSPAALFAITGITATNYSSAAAADQARRASSAAGRALLNKNPVSALSLFQYEPSLGSVVDLSNLTVGVSN